MTGKIITMENQYSILIAEDSPVQGKKLQYVLEKFGYKVKWCLRSDSH
jgi:DNA-binding response OmpR family regulator